MVGECVHKIKKKIVRCGNKFKSFFGLTSKFALKSKRIKMIENLQD